MLRTFMGEPTRWREKFGVGEAVPAMQLLARHEHNVMMVKAIYSLLDGKSLRQSAAE